MAKAAGANYVPRLAQALHGGPGKSVVERVYKFPPGGQISIFQSGPNPIGAENKDRSYSPLWRVVWVHWKKPALVRELTSEEALLAAEEKQELSLEITEIVVNCPITRDQRGKALRGVR
jgi:hypothetical protein